MSGSHLVLCTDLCPPALNQAHVFASFFGTSVACSTFGLHFLTSPSDFVSGLDWFSARFFCRPALSQLRVFSSLLGVPVARFTFSLQFLSSLFDFMSGLTWLFTHFFVGQLLTNCALVSFSRGANGTLYFRFLFSSSSFHFQSGLILLFVFFADSFQATTFLFFRDANDTFHFELLSVLEFE